MPVTAVQINQEITVSQKRRRQEKIEADERRVQFKETTKIFCEDTIRAATRSDITETLTLEELHLFHKFPIELRLKIWRYAIDTPRIITYRLYSKTNLPLPCNLGGSTAHGIFRSTAPALYHVCREAQQETQLAYFSYHTSTPQRIADYDEKQHWIRFDRDIIHIKPISGQLCWELPTLSAHFARPGMIHSFISQWKKVSHRITPRTSDKWIGRPDGFEKIKHLAISRDLLLHSMDDYEPLIRHFFPNLMVLIVLIDEATDIDFEWNIFDLDYTRYEALPNPLYIPPEAGIAVRYPRFDFARKTLGPFTVVRQNIDYRMEVEFEMRNRFAKEETDYNWYTAPKIKVLGANVPEDINVEACGRVPFEKTGEQKHRPFYGILLLE